MADWSEGLASSRVNEQRVRFGSNEIAKERRVKWLKILVNQLTSPLVYVLFAAAAVTYFLGEYIDTGVILFAVGMNAILGFFQEFKAEKSLLALQSVLTPKVYVYRNGERTTVPVNEVVVGDVIFLSDEHRVAADGIVIDEDGLFVEEAILTGESAPVEKFDYLNSDVWRGKELQIVLEELRKGYETIDDKHKLFMGTKVETGVGKILIVRVGKETQVGHLAETLKDGKEEKTPLQKQVQRLSKQLAGMVGLVSIFVLLVGLSVGDSFAEIFPVTVALAVAAIPEGLVISMTVVLAVGMQRILALGAVVRSLTAAETLGSVDVICADKTGTLTEGVMRVTEAVTNLVGKNSEAEVREIAEAAVLCNNMRDPLETAMDEWAKNRYKELGVKEFDLKNERLDNIPFSHKTRFIATLQKTGEMYVSGAPEVILDKSKLTSAQIKQWEEKFRELATKGFRIVGFAKKVVGVKTKKIKESMVGELTWLGVLVYEDPVREGVAEMISEVKQAGIEVKVITGDYKETAEAIMRQIGLLGADDAAKVIVGDELEAMSDEKLLDRINEIVLFARTKPQQKLRIVEALAKKGHVVAMTGDGVNDALALKQSDIGVVVNEASDVAKETADLVLLKNDFGIIVKAVEEGRGIFENLRKILVYLLSDAFAGIILIVSSLILRLELPLLATQILWINLISDGFPSMALTVEPYDRANLLASNRDKRLLDRQAFWLIGLISIVAAVLTLGVFWWYRVYLGESVELARTVAFAMLGMGSLFYVFSARSLSQPIWQVDFFRNKWLIGGVAAGLVLQLSAVYLPQLRIIFGTVPLGMAEWSLVLSGCGGLLLLIEGVKFASRRQG